VAGKFSVLGSGGTAASLVVERSKFVVDADKLATQQNYCVRRETRAIDPDTAAKAVPSCKPSFAWEAGHIVAVEKEADRPQAPLLHHRSLDPVIGQL
jgi:hypothetical protein